MSDDLYEGMSKEKAMAFRARAERELELQSQATESPESSSIPAPPASLAEKMVGGWGGRTLLGMASPALAATQLFGGEPGRQAVANLEAMKQRGMASEGKNGFDWYGLAGSLIPGTGIATGVANALPAATTVLGRAGVGALQGGAVAAAQPSTGISPSDYYPLKAYQIGTGAIAGGAVPLATDLVKGIYHLGKTAIEPIFEQGRANILRRFQENVLGNEPSRIQATVQSAQQAQPTLAGTPPTLGQATAEIPGATGLHAHQQTISRLAGVSPQFTERAAQEEAARAGALVPIARNEGALEGEKAIRDTITGPMRNAALARANIAGREVPILKDIGAQSQTALQQAIAQRQALTPNAITPEPGTLRTAVELHAPPPVPLRSQLEIAQAKILPEEIAKRQQELSNVKQALSSLEEQGMKPLKVAPILSSIRMTASPPGLRASDVVSKSLGELKDKLTTLADEHGTIDAHDLYMVRKEAGNTIHKFASEEKNFDQRLTSGLLSNIQKSMDDAIERAGGTGWKQYLAKYQELSQPIERMQAGQTLQKALTSPLETSERGQVFGKAVKEADLAALSDQDKQVVNRIANELATLDAFKRSAGKTSISGADAIPGRVGIPLPNLLSRPAMIANFIMRKFGESAEDKIAKVAASQYLNPQIYAASMAPQVPMRYRPMIEALMQQAGPAASSAAARQF